MVVATLGWIYHEEPYRRCYRVMVKGFTVGVASIGLAIIMEVTVRGLCREGYHREMLKGYICPFNREEAGSGARVPVWKSNELIGNRVGSLGPQEDRV